MDFEFLFRNLEVLNRLRLILQTKFKLFSKYKIGLYSTPIVAPFCQNCV